MTSINSRLDTIIISNRMQMIEWVACEPQTYFRKYASLRSKRFRAV